MKTLLYFCFFLSVVFPVQGQNYTSFEDMVNGHLTKTVATISTEDLQNNYNDYVILDIRSEVEYNVSHLKGAIHIDPKNLKKAKKKVVKTISDAMPIVVYCSIGYRSEQLGELLIQEGYRVFNLYGGIFKWVNEQKIVYNLAQQPTNNIHPFNNDWGQWLTKGLKTYE